MKILTSFCYSFAAICFAVSLFIIAIGAAFGTFNPVLIKLIAAITPDILSLVAGIITLVGFFGIVALILREAFDL